MLSETLDALGRAEQASAGACAAARSGRGRRPARLRALPGHAGARALELAEQLLARRARAAPGRLQLRSARVGAVGDRASTPTRWRTHGVRLPRARRTRASTTTPAWSPSARATRRSRGSWLAEARSGAALLLPSQRASSRLAAARALIAWPNADQVQFRACRCLITQTNAKKELPMKPGTTLLRRGSRGGGAARLVPAPAGARVQPHGRAADHARRRRQHHRRLLVRHRSRDRHEVPVDRGRGLSVRRARHRPEQLQLRRQRELRDPRRARRRRGARPADAELSVRVRRRPSRTARRSCSRSRRTIANVNDAGQNLVQRYTVRQVDYRNSRRLPDARGCSAAA